ncbi:MAG: hypothetical protein A3E01_06245 [Gammaproteobacteria bacterium RIFCSPHIGHO2_12_FULL_63_22]|nr:MAG: hypothetical protein A3E01_06245 [Gammaproteobacteria bacterium RIFCSPHIGHO2_12_FULL_63_22]
MASLLVLCAGPVQAGDFRDLRSALEHERKRAPAPRLERADFLAKPAIAGARLSPQGRHVAVLREGERGRSVWLLDTKSLQLTRLVAMTDATDLSWSRDGKWLFLESTRQLSKVSVTGALGSGVMLRLDDARKLEVAGIDPTQPAAVLLFEQETRPGETLPSKYRLLRLDVSGRRTVLHEDSRALLDFALAPDGRLAFLKRVDGKSVSIVGRAPGQRWRELVRSHAMERASLIATSDGGRSLLLAGDIASDRRALLRVDLQGKVHRLHEDPEAIADLADVVIDPETQQPLLASYRSLRPSTHGLTPAIAARMSKLQARFPDRMLDISIAAGVDAPWLLHERGDVLQRGRWFLFNPRSGEFRIILDKIEDPSKSLPAAALARRIAFSWRASDGMQLHGFLSVPPGIDPRRLPLLASVHGGPWAQARPGFSTTTQFLANRGYVVFEPNFRGSTGFGRSYLFAAKGDFGNGRVQRDIEEGVRQLLAQGIGDPKRVGITGVSFGGYATLLGITFSPDLFRVGVAVVPPSDFGWTLRWATTNSDISLNAAIPLIDTLKLLSLDISDPTVLQRLRTQSPLANAARLQRPLLMMAGGRDQRVAIRGVVHYAATLRALDKDLGLYIDPKAGHALDEPGSREAYLYLMEDQFHRHLRGARPTPPNAELREQLRRNLRLDARH